MKNANSKQRSGLVIPGLYYHTEDTMRDNIAKCIELNSTAGLQRARAVAAMKAIGKKPAFTCAFGKYLSVVTGEGLLVEKSKLIADAKDASTIEDEQLREAMRQLADANLTVFTDASQMSYTHGRLLEDLVEGSTGLNKVIVAGNVRLPIHCGAVAVVAGTGAGKTPLAHWLAGQSSPGYSTVRISEPFAGNTGNWQMAANAIGVAAASTTDIIIDSVKDLLGDAGGGTMKGGVSRVALAMFSHWSALGAALGVTFYIPVNPSSGSAETLAEIVTAARSSATCTIVNEGGAWKYILRPYDGAERVTGPVPFNDSAEPDRDFDRDSGEGTRVTKLALARDVLEGVVQRSTLSN